MAREDEFLERVILELERARIKFPQQSLEVTTLALAEEAGEVCKAVLQNKFEGKNVTRQDIYDECVQTAVMAIRVALDCAL